MTISEALAAKAVETQTGNRSGESRRISEALAAKAVETSPQSVGLGVETENFRGISRKGC